MDELDRTPNIVHARNDRREEAARQAHEGEPEAAEVPAVAQQAQDNTNERHK
jgi:hypothetical protein